MVERTGRWGQLSLLLRWAIAAREEVGVPIARQFVEALCLRLPPSRLGLSEYFDYRLFERGMSFAEKRRFVGWRGEAALDMANHSKWHVYADDKLALWQLLKQAGISQPLVHAVFGRLPDKSDAPRRLADSESLANWLRSAKSFPLFVKPAHGGFGKGVALLQRHDPVTDSVYLDGIGPVDTDRFSAGLNCPDGLGYLFQEALSPHPELAALTCGRLTTVRVMTLHDLSGEVSIYRAVWKVTRQRNIIDNFESGETGNLLGGIDADCGRVTHVIKGYGLDRCLIEEHPDSGVAFKGVIVPNWAELKDTAVACARLMPEFRFQHWDIALTDRGPVPLEVNLFAAGGTELSQLVDQRGMLENRLLAVCRS